MKDELLTLIKTRRSCRKYTAQQVSDEALHSITEAGLYAPSGHGKQDPVIVVVQDEAMKAQLVAMNAAVMGVSSNPYYNAPTIILVFASADNPNAFQDGSCVLENMMLAAHAEGLASCWINREHQMFLTDEGKALMQKMGLPEGMIDIGALSVGYADGPLREAAERKEGRVLMFK